MSQLALLSPLLEGLNPDQQDAVATLNGPVLVVAAPGSGKTTVLTRRLANLIRSGVTADRILAVTFTRKAATEMQHRVARVLGSKKAAEALTCCTFNSLGLKLLEGHYRRLGFTVDKPHLLVESTQRSLFDLLLREHDALDLRHEDLGQYVSWAKATLADARKVGRITADEAEMRFAKMYLDYQRRLRSMNLLDFDDQIGLAIELLQTQPDVRHAIQSRYTHVLVDEYQDTNKAQYTLMKLLADPQQNLFVVGDDAQGIYGFRAADLDNILNFEQDYPHARRITLETNYRSTPGIVTLANNLIGYNSRQIRKTIRAGRSKDGQRIRNLKALDGFGEAEAVVKGIQELALEGTPPKEMAILYRTHAQAMPILGALTEAQIPFTVKKSDNFYQQAEIQNLLACLRLALPKVHPLAEVSFEGLLRRVGISHDAMSLLKVATERNGGSLWQACLEIERVPIQDIRQTQTIRRTVAMVNGWRRHPGTVADLVMTIFKDTQAREQLEKKKGEKARQKLDCLSIFHEQVTRWAPKSIYNLFEMLDNQMRPRQAKNDDAVQLMTIHASKGLEWDAVFVVGVEEGTLPYQVAVDEGNLAEERRLAYVAITRARRYLQLSHCHERASFGAKKSVTPSRFLTEMMKANPQASTRTPGGTASLAGLEAPTPDQKD